MVMSAREADVLVEQFGANFGARAGSKEFRVLPILFTNPNKSDQQLSITCRLYRQVGAVTEEFLNQRLHPNHDHASLRRTRTAPSRDRSRASRQRLWM